MISSISTVIAGLLSGILASMGLGGGSILIIYLVFFEAIPQLNAQGINLIFFIPIAAVAIIIHSRKKLILWDVAIPAMLSGALAAVFGAYLSTIINPYILRKLFAILLLIVGIRQIFYKGAKNV